ncbi:hypothetical protein CMUS01_05127 [Colletotrichum musicola]|uniref:F-box domain-containing protein n=1 Tax=Colletotrichum musicola TaxID=2175873 RepID=A0A8H6KSW1_9PEZI|nr:hypothetical protein CMUS01_05127 [Colletotrichum musicola]
MSSPLEHLQRLRTLVATFATDYIDRLYITFWNYPELKVFSYAAGLMASSIKLPPRILRLLAVPAGICGTAIFTYETARRLVAYLRLPEVPRSTLPLPTELVLDILGHLPPDSVVAFAMTSRFNYNSYFPRGKPPVLRNFASHVAFARLLERDLPHLIYCWDWLRALASSRRHERSVHMVSPTPTAAFLSPSAGW